MELPRDVIEFVKEVWRDVMPRGTTTIEQVPDGEADNVRAMLRTHDLLSVRYLVTSTIEQ
jgi:hypothetical protein